MPTQPLGLATAHSPTAPLAHSASLDPTKLCAPDVKRCIAIAVLTMQFPDRHISIRLFQKSDNLFVYKQQRDA